MILHCKYVSALYSQKFVHNEVQLSQRKQLYTSTDEAYKFCCLTVLSITSIFNKYECSLYLGRSICYSLYFQVGYRGSRFDDLCYIYNLIVFSDAMKYFQIYTTIQQYNLKLLKKSCLIGAFGLSWPSYQASGLGFHRGLRSLSTPTFPCFYFWPLGHMIFRNQRLRLMLN